MTPPLDAAYDLPPGEYQAEIASVIHTQGQTYPAETIVLFRLTEPGPSSKHPQAGLGGRMARAWFEVHSPNKAARGEAKARLQLLLNAAEASDLDKAIGKIIRIRIARVIRRADPSRYKAAVVEFLPLTDPDVKLYVQP